MVADYRQVWGAFCKARGAVQDADKAVNEDRRCNYDPMDFVAGQRKQAEVEAGKALVEFFDIVQSTSLQASLDAVMHRTTTAVPASGRKSTLFRDAKPRNGKNKTRSKTQQK